MSTNLMEMAGQFLTPDMIGQMSGLLGDDAGKTGALVSAALPMLIAGMGSSAAPTGVDALVKAIAPGGAADPAMLGNLSGLMGNSASAQGVMQAGSGLLSGLFGQKSGLMANALSAFTGAKPGSASSVLAMLVPLLGGMVGKSLMGSGQQVAANTIMSVFRNNKTQALAAMPPELKKSVAGIPGLGTLLGIPAAAAPVAATKVAATAAPVVAASPGIGRFLPWILGLLALGLLGWWLLGRDKVDVATCNTQFQTALTGKTINFDTGDATIAADSQALLGELATIANRCKAFKIEVSGHTDTVGDATMNKELSQRRAAAVSQFLAGKGVPAGQLSAVGYGAERPKVTTGDETAMAANRRIEITVSN